MTTPPKRYIFSERQLAEAFEEWRDRCPMETRELMSGAMCARILLDLIAELAADYAREQ